MRPSQAKKLLQMLKKSKWVNTSAGKYIRNNDSSRALNNVNLQVKNIKDKIRRPKHKNPMILY